MTGADISVHVSDSLRSRRSASGRSPAAVIAEALRSGLYEAHQEMRLTDDGTPRLSDLMPTTKASDGIELPLIRLRSLVPVETDIEIMDAAATVYDCAARRSVVTDRDPGEDHSDILEALNETMIAALSLTITPEMRECAAASIRHVCAVTAPMPWARSHAVVLDRTKKGVLKHIMSVPVHDDFAGRIDPTCSIAQPGRTMTDVPIHMIEAAFAFMNADLLPSPVEAMRTMVAMTTRGHTA